jgi:dipeptidyl aminopeptidase/acylaminoacyl peptidase
LIFNKLIALSSIFMGFNLLISAGPIFGEMIATKSPAFTRQAARSIDQVGISYEQVSFLTTDGLTLRGWFFPTNDPHAPAIIYAPATAHDQRQGISLVAPLHRAGYQVLLFSYRGHGTSDGDRLGFTYGARESEDIDAAVRYLTEERSIPHIGAIGHSAGAVAIILSAARNPRIGAVVAAGTFTSVEDIWEQNRPAIFPQPLYRLAMRMFEMRKGFSRQEVRPLDVIGQIAPRPVLLVHGMSDRRITQQQAAELFANANQPKQIIYVPGASHDQVRSPGLDGLLAQIVQFFDANLRDHPV